MPALAHLSPVSQPVLENMEKQDFVSAIVKCDNCDAAYGLFYPRHTEEQKAAEYAAWVKKCCGSCGKHLQVIEMKF